MIRVLGLFAALGLAVWGIAWFADNPGQIAITLPGVEYDLSLGVGAAFVAATAIVLMVAWSAARLIFKVPSLVSVASRGRRREKGYAALSRGMIAVGSGDAVSARRHADEAAKLIGDEPMTKLLTAQAAQLNGDRIGAANAFKAMLDHSATHTLGLRGLHVEARRAGDHLTAFQYAERAHQSGAGWAGQAVVEEQAKRGDWAKALTALEAMAKTKAIDKPSANRLRAVLKTGIAQDIADRDPRAALATAEDARKLAPGLVPAAALCGRLLAQLGDGPRAAKVLEAAYERTPHPDLAAPYLRLRHGDSALDRLERAKRLSRLAPQDPESALMLAQAMIDARDPSGARKALASLVGEGTARPTVRACVLMAKIADSEGDSGAVREWLARAAHAPRDPAWVAEGIISDHWAPASPSGALDAFQWRTPEESLRPPLEFAAPAAAPQPAISAPPPLPPPAAEPAPARAIEGPKLRPPAAGQTRALNLALPDDPGAVAAGSASPPTGRYFAEG